jgi:HK97 family phage major capsid protein
MKLQEIEDRMTVIRSELDQIAESPESTEESQGDYADTLLGEFDSLKARRDPIVARMQKLTLVRSAADGDGNTEAGTAYQGGNPDIVIRTRQDTFAPQVLDEIRRGGEKNPGGMVPTPELRGRALDAVEFWAKRGELVHDHAENVTGMLQRNPGYYGRGFDAHVLDTGSPEYMDAFRTWMENPEREARRAALSLTLANGGYLLPFVLDPTIILTNSGSANPWRRISNIKQTTSNTWNGVNSAGVTAAWLTEGTITTDTTPTVGNIVVTPQKAAAWVFGSYEVLEDTDFGQQLPRLLADAKDRLEEAAFATGAGSGGVPQGVVNGATTVVTTGTTTVIALADVYAVQAALPPRFRNAPGAAWVANVAIINKFRQLDTAGGASFWTNLGKGQPETLLGAPIYESTTMTSSLATTSLEAIFGDFGQFIIVDRVGVSMIYEPLVKGTGGILPAGQAGWFMFWRTGSQLSTVNAFRVMKGL